MVVGQYDEVLRITVDAIRRATSNEQRRMSERILVSAFSEQNERVYDYGDDEMKNRVAATNVRMNEDRTKDAVQNMSNRFSKRLTINAASQYNPTNSTTRATDSQPHLLHTLLCRAILSRLLRRPTSKVNLSMIRRRPSLDLTVASEYRLMSWTHRWTVRKRRGAISSFRTPNFEKGYVGDFGRIFLGVGV